MKTTYQYTLLIIAFLFVLFSVFTNTSSAQETRELEEKYDLSFPIAELGDCKNIGECRSFCDDPVNSSVCIEYAEDKGFYDQGELEENLEIALKRAKNELGCDSEVSCKNLCEQPSSYSKCSQFAQRHNIGGGIVENPSSQEIVKKAQETLGCNSETTCKNYCEKDENRSKCSEFAKQVGLRGGEMRVGPGGCTSGQTCRTFCSNPDNFRVCQGFAGAQGGAFSGPGGCNSEDSCKAYCEENPLVCGNGPNTQENKQLNPLDMCNRTPGCYWNNNNCNCNSNYQTSNIDPAKECVKYSGCTWLGNSCRCHTPIYTSSGSYNSEEYKASCVSGGCNWTGSGCDCSGTNGPAMECGNKGCSWVNSACQCSSNYTPSGASSSFGTSYSEGSSMNREQQEYFCKAGGGTCDWGSGYCNCKGYTSSSSSTSTSGSSGGSTTSSGGSSSTTTTTYTSPSSAPSGMTRESQQAGCTSCGGTCSWNGDFCSCNCGSTTSQTTSTPPPATSAPTYVDPYEQCIQSGGSWAGNQCYPGGVQGASIIANFWEWIISLLRR